MAKREFSRAFRAGDKVWVRNTTTGPWYPKEYKRFLAGRAFPYECISANGYSMGYKNCISTEEYESGLKSLNDLPEDNLTKADRQEAHQEYIEVFGGEY